MPRYIAFLRAINVGGHNVKMDVLRSLFESMSFSKVETFIASGNVIFESNRNYCADLEQQIEEQLFRALGYKAATFIRTDEQVARIADYQPFDAEKLNKAGAYNVGFLKDHPDNKQHQNILDLKNENDDFHISGTELYWICQTRQSDSIIDAKKLERALLSPITLRSIKTVKRLNAKYKP